MKDISTPPRPRMTHPSNFSWGTTLRGPIFPPIWAPSPLHSPIPAPKINKKKSQNIFLIPIPILNFQIPGAPRHNIYQKKALNAIGAPAPFSEPLLISHELLELYSPA